ncbi:MAG TPA: hypothetical protein VK648_03530, partial [Gemmatimonadaceae bacterium]|nr:hypothetical protein [Gemmatimonadaceae bacterium]
RIIRFAIELLLPGTTTSHRKVKLPKGKGRSVKGLDRRGSVRPADSAGCPVSSQAVCLTALSVAA